MCRLADSWSHGVLCLCLCNEKFKPLTTNDPYHIETSQLICIENQLTGFYMMGNIGR